MRLRDIEVDEVSLVDKAANRRVFPVVKRETKEEEKKEEVKTEPQEYQPTKEDVEAIINLTKDVQSLKENLGK